MTTEKPQRPSKTKLYYVWMAIRQRCSMPSRDRSSYYMARGITVCDEWSSSFDAFKSWAMDHGYAEGLQIDRINTSGNYEPSNCRWATRIVNMNNRSNNVRVVFRGEEAPLMDAIRTSGTSTSASTIRERLSRGWDAEKAILTPARVGNYRRGHR